MDPLSARATMQLKNRLSVKNLGVGLAGLDGVNQKVPVTGETKMLIIRACKNLGVVKLNTDGKVIEGVAVKTGSAKTWEQKMDLLAPLIKNKEPTYFVLFRTSKNCLIVTFVPDDAKPSFKMRYASNKESLKDALLELEPEMDLEEFNVSEVVELSYAKYESKNTAPKPYSEAELRRQEEESADTGGNYGALARIIAMQQGTGSSNRDVKSGASGAKPKALPGMAGGMGGLNLGNLRASLKPINNVRISTKKNGVAGFSTVPVNKKSAMAEMEEHYKKTMAEFGVNDREKKARLEIDLIMAEKEEVNDEMLPDALKSKMNANDPAIDDLLQPTNSARMYNNKMEELSPTSQKPDNELPPPAEAEIQEQNQAQEVVDNHPEPNAQIEEKPKKKKNRGFFGIFSWLFGRKKRD